jgi:UDP-hydrolysing UDP-N-acetyl-D-glucosamine 2-epimerase
LNDKYGHTLESELNSIAPLKIDRIELGDLSKSTREAGTSLGVSLQSFSEYLHEKKPDAVILLGDRMETLVFAVASSISDMPIVHLHGGELTTGALDEIHRHAISKLSSLHFTADAASKRRLESMGENPKMVLNFGSPREDFFRNFDPLSLQQLGQKLGISLPEKFAVVTVHPALHDNPSTHEHLLALFSALENVDDLFVLFTGTNSDPGSDGLRESIQAFMSKHPKSTHFVESLGSDLYLSALTNCSVAIGNSSSLILEARVIGTPTVLLGNRQLGRASAAECLDANPSKILTAIKRAISTQRQSPKKVVDASVSKRIVDSLLESHPISTRKVFYENA